MTNGSYERFSKQAADTLFETLPNFSQASGLRLVALEKMKPT